MTTPHDAHPYAPGSPMRNAHKAISDRIWALNLETRDSGADPAAVLTAADALAHTVLESLAAAGYEVVRLPEPEPHPATGNLGWWRGLLPVKIPTEPGKRGVLVDGSHIDTRFVRTFAAALLAAANHQEKNDD